MNKKNNRNFQETQLMINHSFLSLLAKRDFDTITISDVCKEAGITRATFYAHHGSIFDLLQNVELELSQEVLDRLFVNGVFQSKNCFALIFSYLRDHQDFYRIYLNHNWKMPVFELATENISGMGIDQFANVVGIEDAHELRYHKSFFMAGLNSLVRIWLADNCQDSPEYMGNLISKQYHFDSVLKELSRKHRSNIEETT